MPVPRPRPVADREHSIGDQFARWTSLSHLARLILSLSDALFADNVFRSTVHRAINRSGAERYSIPLFFGTDYDVLLTVRTNFGILRGRSSHELLYLGSPQLRIGGLSRPV
jgi:hypothetical protein